MPTSANSVSGDVSLPDHVQQAIDAFAELHAKAHKDATPQQRAIERFTQRLGQPAAVSVVLAVLAVWIVANAALKATGHEPFDPFPYPALQGLATLGALLMTILILTTESRLGDIGERRARLALQIGILTEQKVATTIKLLEQLRRDHPDLHEVHDEDVRAMSQASDPAALLKALDDVHEAVVSED